MNEHLDKVKEYLELFDELSKEEQLEYIWECWGSLIQDVVREWEPETLDESILELKELIEDDKKVNS